MSENIGAVTAADSNADQSNPQSPAPDLSSPPLPRANDTVESLRFEVARLKIELSQAETENRKAAQFGLELLEEKQDILKSKSSLERECDSLRDELSRTKHSLDQKLLVERQFRELSRDEEDAIEQEKLARESLLSENVNQLKFDLKKSQEAQYQLQQEVERLTSRERELLENYKSSEVERMEMKSSLKQLKDREKRLNNEVYGLEEENVHLQQQVSNLRMRQIENDKLTGERDRLEEKCLELTKECEDLAQMKETFKSYYEKTIEALNSEKEQKKTYVNELEKLKHKQEIDRYIPYQTRSANHDFADDESIQSDVESLLNNHDSYAATSLQEELKQLDPNIGDKIDLERFANDDYQDLDESISGTPRHSRYPSSTSEVANSPHKSTSSNFNSDNNQTPSTPVIEDSKVIDDLRRRNQSLQQEIAQLRASLLETSGEESNGVTGKYNGAATVQEESPNANFENALKQESESLKLQLQQTKDKLRESERRLGGLEDEHRAVVSCSLATLDEVVSFSREISTLHQMLNQDSDQNEQPADVVNESTDSSTKKTLQEKLDEVIAGLQSTKFRESAKFDTELPMEMVALVQKQVRVVKRTYELLSAKRSESDYHKLSTNTSESGNENQEGQIEKLKLEVTKKREQITSLRAVLKANKNTAEVAMNQIKARYEQERQRIHDSLNKAKNELKTVRSDSATFAYIRSMLVSRVDMLTNQYEMKNKECRNLNEKILTLEQVLRMAINQKLALTERLEALETAASPDQSTSSKSSAGSQKNFRGGKSAYLSGQSRSHIPPRYAKNPRASDASYVKKAFLQRDTNP